MKVITIIAFVTFTFSSQALKLRTLSITPERLKLIQENSFPKINHEKLNDIIEENPEFERSINKGTPPYKTPYTKLPQVTVDRTEGNLTN